MGRLREIPGVFSQGETIEELEENIRDVYQLMMKEGVSMTRSDVQTKELEVDV